MPRFEMCLVGLEYIVEIQRGPSFSTCYQCEMCGVQETVVSVLGHLQSAFHRLNYLRQFFPSLHKKFAQVPNLKNWEGHTFGALEHVIKRIEATRGRLRPLLVADYAGYMQN